MNIDPKGWEAAEVVSILTEVLENYADTDVTEKIKRVSDLLKRYPQLCEKREVFVSLHEFKESSIDPKIKALLLNVLPNQPGKAPLEQVPKDLHRQLIAPHLTSSDIASLTETSKKLDEIYRPAWEKIKADITIGVDDWKQVGVEVTDAPPLPDNIDAILKAECPFFRGKKVFETSELVLIPGNVSIRNQVPLIGPLGIERIPGRGSSRWVLVTRDVIPGSENQPYQAQQDLVAEKEGYRIPTLKEANFLLKMHFQKKEVYLLSETYTRCHDKDIHGNPLFIGFFRRWGPYASSGEAEACRVDTGVLAVREFSGPSVIGTLAHGFKSWLFGR